MVIQLILLSGIVISRVLPGAALHYGGLGLWGKKLCFLMGILVGFRLHGGYAMGAGP